MIRREQAIQHKADSSLQRAQSLAKNILNLSQSDIEDIMSADGDPERMAMVRFISSLVGECILPFSRHMQYSPICLPKSFYSNVKCKSNVLS